VCMNVRHAVSSHRCYVDENTRGERKERKVLKQQA